MIFRSSSFYRINDFIFRLIASKLADFVNQLGDHSYLEMTPKTYRSNRVPSIKVKWGCTIRYASAYPFEDYSFRSGCHIAIWFRDFCVTTIKLTQWILALAGPILCIFSIPYNSLLRQPLNLYHTQHLRPFLTTKYTLQ